MSNKMINGFMLVETPWSALNNGEVDRSSSKFNNVVPVKSIRIGHDIYPYVSGQAHRAWIRKTLGDKFNWKLSSITREEKAAYVEANPIINDDDDMFGYMNAKKVAKNVKGSKDDKRKVTKNTTVTRVSPFKVSPLLSIYPQRIVRDYGVMARQEENPTLYQHEFYSTVLKGIFSIDIDSSGKFYDIDRSGYKNLSRKFIKLAEEKGCTHNEEEHSWTMPLEIRRKRIKDLILVLPYLSGGAKLTEHLTDVSPKFIVLAVIDGGNHIFMDLADQSGIRFDVLEETVNDYRDIILSDIYIGKKKGFMDEANDSLDDFSAKEWKVGNKTIKVHTGTVVEMTKAFADRLDEFIK